MSVYPQPNYVWSSGIWPPETYYTGFGPFYEDRKRDQFIHPIDGDIVLENGKRVLRYMLPTTPVQPGSVRIDGHIFDRANGELFMFTKVPGVPGPVVGSIDHTTGLIVINVMLSPSLGRRRAEWTAPAIEPTTHC